MENKQETPEAGKRKHGWFGKLHNTEIPLVVYAVIFASMAVLWVIQEIHPDVTLGLLTELGGAAFTLFIIDTLLVRSKTRRWRLVRDHVDYLIARHINRLRDGIAVRVFGFHPEIPENAGTDFQATLRTQRADCLQELGQLSPDGLKSRLSREHLFQDDTYAYLHERAAGLWDLINMKYAEFMEPDLVSILMHLHTHLKDLEGHIRQYARGDWFPEHAAFYHAMAETGASVSALEIVRLVNQLKEMGYSEAATFSSVSDAFIRSSQPAVEDGQR